MAGTVICDYINSANVSGGFLGIGQTWQTVTASRAYGVTYTNTTGKPILVNAYGHSTADADISFIINGVLACVDSLSPVKYGGVLVLVPNGATYSLTSGSGTFIVDHWSELR